MKNQILNEEFRRMQKLAGIITEEHSEMINEEGMTLPIPNFLKMGEPEFKVNFVKFSNNSKNGEKSQVRNDGSFPVSVETDAQGKGPGNKFVINAYVTKEGNLDQIFLPGYDNSEVLVKYVKDWGPLRKYIASELAKTPTAAALTAESIEQVVNEALRVYRKKSGIITDSRMVNEEVANEDIQIGAEYTAMMPTDSTGNKRTPVKVKVLGRDRSDETKVIITPLQDEDYKNAESGQMNRFTKGSQYGSEAKYLSK